VLVIAHHARSGIVGLNVVTAALPDHVEVRFARDRSAVATALERSSGPAIVAWSFYSPDFEAAAADMAWVKARSRPALHVAGGVHATAEPLLTLRAGFDRVAIGEGEATAAALFEGPGTARLDSEGRLVTAGPAARRPLDDFPAFNARHGKFNAIEITRGCIYACSFCQTPFMFKARFRHRSVANVRLHVAAMRRAGLRYVRFLTPTSLSYGSDGERPCLEAVEELLAAARAEIGPAGKVYFGTFPSEVRPEHVSREALAVLRRYVDNEALVIGGQSGSDRVLREMRRGHSVEEVERAVRLCVEAGFRPDVDFLLGIPGETPDDRRASLAFAQRLVALGAKIHSHAFMPLPGTPLRDALPEPIEADAALEMARLESSGAMHGQWKRQTGIANRLVELRRAR